MKLAVSNIAWELAEEENIAAELSRLGVERIELALTKKWADPTVTLVSEASGYFDFWRARGFEIVAFQSMLYNRPDLKIFESAANRVECLAYLKKFIDLAKMAGAKVLVFGSPKNRQKGGLNDQKAIEIAAEFFKTLGDYAASKGLFFCIEPNPKQYGCDFVTTASQGIELVDRVASPGFDLHLDIGGMSLAGDNLAESIKAAGSRLKHLHISAPQLDLPSAKLGIDYNSAAAALRAVNYRGVVSIEMRPGQDGDNLGLVRAAVDFAKSTF